MIVPTLTTKADEVARTLEDEIVSGAVAPGQVLRQEGVCARFGVSRTPVREALQRLEALGLVTALPNRGARVRSISSAELREAFMIRAELESLATAQSAQRITAEQLARLDAAEEQLLRVVLAGDFEPGDGGIVVGPGPFPEDIGQAVDRRRRRADRGIPASRPPGWLARSPPPTSPRPEI